MYSLIEVTHQTWYWLWIGTGVCRLGSVPLRWHIGCFWLIML